jgi:outer membrane lipoprotein-sorting protein
LDKIKSVKTLQIFGKMMIQGMEAEFSVIQKRPNLFRRVVNLQGQEIVVVSNGEKFWMVNPMMGSSEPQELPAAQAKRMRDEGDMDGSLISWKEKELTLELVGKETIESGEAYNIKVTTKDTTVRNIYVDAKTFLEVMAKAKIKAMGQEMEVETVFSDQRDVEGVKIPFMTESKMNGQPLSMIQIERVELNKPVDDSVFTKPDGK